MKKLESALDFIRLSERRLEEKDPVFFQDLLPSSLCWRFFPEFRDATVYLDIETTGLGHHDAITTIALYDGRDIKHYVNGENLDDFVDDIQRYKVMVTFNGKTFDVPFIQRYFDIVLNHAHIDLRYVMKSLGYSGGLKNVERELGVERKESHGLDGYFAVLLWHDYKRRKNRKALDTLLAYNIEDVVNLEQLMIEAYKRNIATTPFADDSLVPDAVAPKNPFSADIGTIVSIRDRAGIY